MRDEEECTCDDYAPWELHPCPFQSDVNDDPDDFCSCCPHCESECAMEI
jgi:hypothetical protein